MLVITGAGWLAQPGGAALAIFLGVVPTAAAYLLFARGLRRLSAAETATLTLAEPLTAALLGVIVLSERMSAPAALGAVLILGGLLVLAAPEVRRAGYRRGVTAVESVAAALRQEILSGERPAGERLVEQDLCARYGVARHSLRAALRALAAEGLVRVETNRGARVARLDADEIIELYELRTALEVEAARLALERHGGRLPAGVHVALAELERACEAGVWGAINDAHADLHGAIVAAALSPRIEAAHARPGRRAAAVPQPARAALERREDGRRPRRARAGAGARRAGSAAGASGGVGGGAGGRGKGRRAAGPCRRPARPVRRGESAPVGRLTWAPESP